MSSFGFGSGFGASQPAQTPFGSSPSPFGAPPSVFGQQGSTPFGASSSTSLFGSSTPAFGAAQTPAFGASSAAFGSSGFGAPPSGGGAFGQFGQTPAANPFAASQPGFGAPSTPAFGAQSTPAFGAQPFGASSGASPFGGGGGGFGAASTPAFGTPGFGAASTPAFGSTGFGAGFGQQPGFGMQQQQQQQGTKDIRYQKVAEQEGGAGSSSRTTVQFCSILAMPQFRDANEKSPLELRWEDFQMGVKGNTGGQAPAGNAFGQPGGFGAPAQSSPFGGSSLFGGAASTPAFGQASTPAFGSSFGQSSSAFGGSSASLFGKPASTPAFGQGSSPFGGSTFGAASTPAFGQAGGAFGGSTPAPAQQSAPAFGSTGFGAGFGSSTPAFGTPQSTPAFGGSLFGGTPAQTFGSTPGFSFSQASSSAFSFPSSAPAFGQSSSTPQPFGGASTGGFSFGQQPASTPGFGGGGLFGQTASKPFGSTFGASQPFGASSPSPFGGSTGGGLFGAPASSAAFGGGGLFGAAPNTGTSLFSFNQPQQQQQQQQGQNLQTIQLPGIATSPYGMLPPAPHMAGDGGPPIAEYRVGLSQQPIAGLLAPRTAALLAPRTITPRSGFSTRVLTSRSRRQNVSLTEGSLFKTPGSSGTSDILVSRGDPRSFFVRANLPDTEDMAPTSRSPSLTPTPQASREDQATSHEGPVGVQHKSPASNGFSSLPQPSTGRESPEAARASPQKEASASDRAPAKETQRSPAGPSSSHYLTDSEVSELLPKVAKTDAYVEPSLTQLAAMAREDRNSLANVSNFKVGHRRHGHVIWREPVDVCGLDVDHAISFTKGAVEVYLHDKQKPPIGEGLNKPAEVTLLGIYKTDKATGSPATDHASVEKFVKRLKRTAASQNARFLEYNPQKGLWRFEVDHFSKYGLVSDSDSEDEAMTTGPETERQMKRPLGGDASVSMTQSDEAVGMQEGDEVEGPLDEQRVFGDGPERLGLISSDVQRAAASPVLFHALPAALNLNPASLSQMQRSLYDEEPSEDPLQRPAKRRTAEGSHLTELNQSSSSKERTFWDKAASLKTAEVSGATKLALNCWEEHKSGLTAPSKQLPSAAALGVVAHSNLKSESCLTAYTQKSSERASAASLTDAGAAMGSSFRVGWSLNNAFIHPGSLGATGKVSSLLMKHVNVNKVMNEATEQLPEADRRRFRALLELHKASSRPEPAEEGAPPHWRLQCSAKELKDLCNRYCRVNEDFQREAEVPQNSLADFCLEQETHTWELVSVLFCHIGTNQLSQSRLLPQEDVGEGESNFAEASPEESQSFEDSLAISFKRRAALSQWLRKRVRREVEEGLMQKQGALASIGILLSGGDLPQAAALAASSGHMRLAITIMQAGGSAVARQDVADQLQQWQRTELDKHMDPQLLNIYYLLAGDPTPLIEQLELDWHRAFGLFLWYATPPDAPLEAALQAYTDAAATAETAPRPTPLYAEKLGWLPGQRRTSDLAFTLLQLATGRLALDNPHDVAQLLSAESYAPEPLSALHGWLILQTLTAIGVAESTPALHQQRLMLTSDVIAQLHTVGGLPEWEIYVASQMPTSPHPDHRHARSAAVATLLRRNAVHWTREASKREFVYELGVSREWIADALAIYARSIGNKTEELEQLIDAGAWATAHKLLIDELAPSWLFSSPDRRERLQAALLKLRPHRAEIDEAEAPLRPFNTGAGLYSAYLLLKDIVAQKDLEPEEDAELTDLLHSFTGQLSEAAANKKSGTQFASYRVLAKMADDAVQWLLERSERLGIDSTERDTTILGITPLFSQARRDHLQLAAVSSALASCSK